MFNRTCLRPSASSRLIQSWAPTQNTTILARCLSYTPPRFNANADSAGFEQKEDKFAFARRGVKAKGRSKLFGFIIAMVPVTGFVLGTWQVYRRNWKLELIEKYEAHLDLPPAILPPNLDATKAEEFDHRRILMKGQFLHDQEMLIGPRQWNGETGFHVITPFQRDDGTRVLVNRGWIPRARGDKSTRPKGLVGGEVVIEGLVRPPPGKGYFQHENEPNRGLFYYLNLEEMGGMVGADQGFFVEEIFDPNRSWSDKFIVDGKPIGRVPQVNLKNNHMQYIITWYSLGVITSFMLFRLMRQPANRVKMRVKAA
ncbi:SURF1-domain-containing protein [Saitoella complicata NRRL Y-17804]|uniref:SURF1-like protein n=1 Tax=Saitoella complicata (strain BCRC 22490 / CBS 7301 / JCM 7358 / NBRC 10748 / NRRL Y-17804) TaxID=698492 RepID=A0A0E9NRQ0_SAICN|nr:SURF1-domain-containing protein [Saitoella complicata NRRL Y-17804]ODQ50578.1 SURF1-domain-containing protein [Saitoella complicata NRRL Y-17804]GAO52539.1 hypothetical protein G7K_6613-t1 [Saitoella complicata NRRL Y-17804]